MSLAISGFMIWSMGKKEKNRVFRFTSFEDEDHVQHAFLVYSPNFELAQEDAVKMIILNGTEIQKVEELDIETWDVIETPYHNVQKSSVKIKKI
jgi:hypothetical protein